MTSKISEFYSDDRQRTAIVFKEENVIGWRLFMYDSYFETEKERFFLSLSEAEMHGEFYVQREGEYQ